MNCRYIACATVPNNISIKHRLVIDDGAAVNMICFCSACSIFPPKARTAQLRGLKCSLLAHFTKKSCHTSKRSTVTSAYLPRSAVAVKTQKTHEILYNNEEDNNKATLSLFCHMISFVAPANVTSTIHSHMYICSIECKCTRYSPFNSIYIFTQESLPAIDAHTTLVRQCMSQPLISVHETQSTFFKLLWPHFGIQQTC